MRSSRRVITPDWLPMKLWCFSAAVSSRVLDLVICKTLFGNKYIILWHWLFCTHFLYGICVNLIRRHTYYEYLVWVLKSSMIEWYESCVYRRNASIVRWVIFERLFSNENYFYSIPLQNLYSATYLVCYLALFSPFALEKVFTDILQIFPKFLASPSLHFHLQAPQWNMKMQWRSYER
jgi:hypothetical protein